MDGWKTGLNDVDFITCSSFTGTSCHETGKMGAGPHNKIHWPDKEKGASQHPVNLRLPIYMLKPVISIQSRPHPELVQNVGMCIQPVDELFINRFDSSPLFPFTGKKPVIAYTCFLGHLLHEIF